MYKGYFISEIKNKEIVVAYDFQFKHDWKKTNHIDVKKNDIIYKNDDRVNVTTVRFYDLDEESFLLCKELLSAQKKDSFSETNPEKFWLFFKDLFSNNAEFSLSKLIGDIGELILILLLQKYDIDYTKFYQIEDGSLIDFVTKKFYVDVKTTTANQKRFSTTLNQMKERNGKSVKYFIVEINKQRKTSGNFNILDLIEKIKNKSTSIKLMKTFWTEKYKKFSSQIDSWCVTLKDVSAYFFKSECIPNITIEDIPNSKLHKVTCEFRCDGCETNTFEKNLSIWK